MGSWRSLAVWKEGDLLRIPADLMPLEQCALLRETITAYRLLEDNASLKVGRGARGWRGGVAGPGRRTHWIAPPSDLAALPNPPNPTTPTPRAAPPAARRLRDPERRQQHGGAGGHPALLPAAPPRRRRHQRPPRLGEDRALAAGARRGGGPPGRGLPQGRARQAQVLRPPQAGAGRGGRRVGGAADRGAGRRRHRGRVRLPERQEPALVLAQLCVWQHPGAWRRPGGGLPAAQAAPLPAGPLAEARPPPAPLATRRSAASTCGSGCGSTARRCPPCSSRWRAW